MKRVGSPEGFSSWRRFPFLDWCLQTQHKKASVQVVVVAGFLCFAEQNIFFSDPHSFRVRTIVFLSFLILSLKSRHMGKLL
jgi:hypothetical protein